MIKPSYDLSTLKTNHEIILFVRDQILEPMNLRIRLYPSFVKQTKNKNREELLILVKKIILKAKELSQELEKPTLPKPATEPFSKVEKIKSTKNTRERELLNTSTNTRREIIRPEICTSLSLSVWPMIQEKLNNPDTVKDPSFFNRLRNYSKRALFIIHVLDTFQVLTSYEAWRKAQEITGISIRSRSTVGDLLKDLYTDGFLELEIIERKTNPVPAKVYSIIEYRENYPEKYARATARHRDNIKRLENHTSNNSHEQKNERINDIEVKATESMLAQKRGYAKAREIEQEELEKTATLRRTQREAEAEPQPKKLFTKPFSETETQDQLMVNRINKMKPEQVQNDIKTNPRFKAEYDRLKGEGLL